MKATGVKELREILTLAEFHLSDLVIIEEAQFFPDLYEIVLRLVETNQKRVVVVGLDGDSERKPFGQILDLVPIADTVTKLTALCKRCNDGSVALFSGFLNDKKDKQVCVGGTETYEPMCRRHYLMNKRG
jgi:thymidine kinase